jgi:hypothetical protein
LCISSPGSGEEHGEYVSSRVIPLHADWLVSNIFAA